MIKTKKNSLRKYNRKTLKNVGGGSEKKDTEPFKSYGVNQAFHVLHSKENHETYHNRRNMLLINLYLMSLGVVNVAQLTENKYNDLSDLFDKDKKFHHFCKENYLKLGKDDDEIKKELDKLEKQE